ncbi:hypothetical protein [Halomonas sp. ND22Bw]|uniref:hypothetical protein n=1 Tax=Halomonas sp. ND22Bw TaxID=2054178 RepID=UPI0011B1D060
MPIHFRQGRRIGACPGGSVLQGSNSVPVPDSGEAAYETHEARVWQAWLPAEVQAPGDSFTLSIDYPDSLLKSSHMADFIFHKPKADEGGFSVELADNVAVRKALTNSLRVVVS